MRFSFDPRANTYTVTSELPREREQLYRFAKQIRRGKQFKYSDCITATTEKNCVSSALHLSANNVGLKLQSQRTRGRSILTQMYQALYTTGLTYISMIFRHGQVKMFFTGFLCQYCEERILSRTPIASIIRDHYHVCEACATEEQIAYAMRLFSQAADSSATQVTPQRQESYS